MQQIISPHTANTTEINLLKKYLDLFIILVSVHITLCIRCCFLKVENPTPYIKYQVNNSKHRC